MLQNYVLFPSSRITITKGCIDDDKVFVLDTVLCDNSNTTLAEVCKINCNSRPLCNEGVADEIAYKMGKPCISKCVYMCFFSWGGGGLGYWVSACIPMM